MGGMANCRVCAFPLGPRKAREGELNLCPLSSLRFRYFGCGFRETHSVS